MRRVYPLSLPRVADISLFLGEILSAHPILLLILGKVLAKGGHTPPIERPFIELGQELVVFLLFSFNRSLLTHFSL